VGVIPPGAAGGAAEGAASALATFTRFSFAFGAVIGVVTAAVLIFKKLTEIADKMAERFSAVNAQIATAQARGQVRMLMGDIRRAERVAPELAQYIEARTDLQQKYEDMKVEFMKHVLPLLTAGLSTLNAMVPNVDVIPSLVAGLTGVAPGTFKTLVDILKVVNAINHALANAGKDETTEATRLILGNTPLSDWFKES
jgi:hypothetical protein